MTGWMVAVLLVALAAGLWWLNGPSTHQRVSRADLEGILRSLLLEMHRGAWVEVSAGRRLRSLLVRKEDEEGRRLLLQVNLADQELFEELLCSTLIGLLQQDGVAATEKSVEQRRLTLQVSCAGDQLPAQAISAVTAALEQLGVMPPFRVKAKGRPNLERSRPVFQSWKDDSPGSSSQRIGEQGVKFLDRRRSQHRGTPNGDG